MIEGALEADGRIAAKNAVKVRAALRELADYKQLFLQYQDTQPISTDNLAKDRARARAWAIMNVTQMRTEALASALWRMWAEAWVLGDVAAGEWIQRTQELNKADDGYVDWSKWQPGDRAAAIMLKRPKAFQEILNKTNASIKSMTTTSITDIGNALADAVELGLDAERAAVLIGRHVASPARALTIAITEQNRVMSAATIARYKEAELEKMEWHVSDPCAKCAQNANVEVVIGTSFPSGNTQPPAHPHCRCVLLPVIPGMEEPNPMGVDGGLAPMPVGAAVVETPPNNYRVFTDAEERNEFNRYQLENKKFIEIAYRANSKDTIGYTALKNYKSYGYGKINDYLRTGQVSPIEASRVKEYIKAIDKVMRAAPGLPEPIITYRIVGQGRLSTQIDELFAGLNPGDVWIDKGYSSTTLDKGFLATFKDGWEIEIENPQGTKGVMLDGLSMKDGYENKENELLLPRDTNFEVIETNPTTRTMKVRVKQ